MALSFFICPIFLHGLDWKALRVCLHIFGKRQRQVGFLLHSRRSVFWLRAVKAKGEIQELQAVLQLVSVAGVEAVPLQPWNSNTMSSQSEESAKLKPPRTLLIIQSARPKTLLTTPKIKPATKIIM